MTTSRVEARLLTFVEADLFEKAVKTYLRVLEEQGMEQSQEAEGALQLLRNFVYFTVSDSVEDIIAYLRAQGWVVGVSRGIGYKILYAPAGQTSESGERVSLLLPNWIYGPEEEKMLMRSLKELTALEDSEQIAVYDLLLRIRAHAEKNKAGA